MPSTKPVPLPNCPEAARIHANVPMAHVADVDASAEFYSLLGFACDSRFSGPDGITNWSSLSSGAARMMLARASEPVVASQQAVLFYMYSNDVAALRAHLLAQAVRDAGRPLGERPPVEHALIPQGAVVFEIGRPSYMPQGELRIHDPDGYVILVGQLG